jgi:A/G-specific adenine glycosylase
VTDPLQPAVLAWYRRHARDLPWRRAERTPWGVLVSEIMLQQTPVSRVLPVWTEWMARWPEPADLAAETVGEAIRAWGRLGYPRRARRLHAAACELVERFGGAVPEDEEDLRSLPGVGDYTSAAVRAFAFDRRSVVLDTNVRRVLTRLLEGRAGTSGGVTRAELSRAELLIPHEDGAAAAWSAAVMELGALVCVARTPRCEACPVSSQCRWQAAGRPAADEPTSPTRPQPYLGTDRYVRGLILAAVRESHDPVPGAVVDALWRDTEQLDRAVRSLVADGLLERLPDAAVLLPQT